MEQAGWTAHAEQEVLPQMADQPVRKRADGVETSFEGMRFVIDVRSLAVNIVMPLRYRNSEH